MLKRRKRLAEEVERLEKEAANASALADVLIAQREHQRAQYDKEVAEARAEADARLETLRLEREAAERAAREELESVRPNVAAQLEVEERARLGEVRRRIALELAEVERRAAEASRRAAELARESEAEVARLEAEVEEEQRETAAKREALRLEREAVERAALAELESVRPQLEEAERVRLDEVRVRIASELAEVEREAAAASRRAAELARERELEVARREAELEAEKAETDARREALRREREVAEQSARAELESVRPNVLAQLEAEEQAKLEEIRRTYAVQADQAAHEAAVAIAEMEQVARVREAELADKERQLEAARAEAADELAALRLEQKSGTAEIQAPSASENGDAVPSEEEPAVDAEIEQQVRALQRARHREEDRIRLGFSRERAKVRSEHREAVARLQAQLRKSKRLSVSDARPEEMARLRQEINERERQALLGEIQRELELKHQESALLEQIRLDYELRVAALRGDPSDEDDSPGDSTAAEVKSRVLIDPEALRQRLQETELTQQILRSRIAEDDAQSNPETDDFVMNLAADEDSGLELVNEAEVVDQTGLGALPGLDLRLSVFARKLVELGEVDRGTAATIAEDLGIPLIDAAIDRINEACMDACGEMLFEGDDLIVSNTVAVEEYF